MSILRRKTRSQQPLTEDRMIDICSALWPSPNFKFRNFFYRYGYEADLFVISKARYATEVEVKLSFSDWNADIKKDKHRDLKYIKHFYYAVPTDLLDRQPQWLDPRYGLIEVFRSEHSGELYARIIRPAADLKNGRCPKRIVVSAFYGTYFKLADARHTISILRDLRQ